MIELPDDTGSRILIDPGRIESLAPVRTSTTRVTMVSGKTYIVPLSLDAVKRLLEECPHATRHE